MSSFYFSIMVINYISYVTQAIDSSILTISVDENTPVGRKISNLYNELKLKDSSITFVPLNSNYFRLSKNGELFIQHSLDRDNDSNLCADPGYPDICSVTTVVWLSNSHLLSLRIVINDLNDNKPFWSSAPRVSVAENSQINMEVDLPLAIDKDTSTNGIEKYRFVDNNIPEFELKNRQSPNGVIPKLVVKQQLDREKISSYNLTIAAIDGAIPHHTGLTTLFIDVADLNDNSPVFEENSYRVTIPENFPIHTYLPITPKATDKDSDKFGEVSYCFSIATPEEVKQIFTINKNDGRILIEKNIDYDGNKHFFEFILVAMDGGSPYLSATAMVTIKITDLNDQPPTIVINSLSNKKDESSNVVEIEENKHAKELVTTITVSDTDEGEGGKFNCSLSPNNSFQLKYYRTIDQYSVYQLISERQFDREIEHTIRTKIICQDKGDPIQTGKKLITVNVIDVNDNAPKFTESRYKFTINEGNDENSEVAKVLAKDYDSGENGRVEYSILQNTDELEWFSINNRGIINALKSLDREVHPKGFKFKVFAKDCGNPFLNDSVEVEIELMDVNDCIPKFSKEEYKYPVMENDVLSPNIPETIGILEATDCDIGNNAKKTFLLVQSSSLFKVMSDGQVTVTAILDREIQSSYSLHVQVIDGSPSDMIRHTSTSRISITVSDRNDNPPLFIPSINISAPIRVSYDEEVGIELIKVMANDKDSGINAMVSYKFKSQNFNTDLFMINPSTGSVTIAKRLSSKDEGEHILTVVASDNGIPSLSSDLLLKVIIDDSSPRSISQQSTKYLINNNKLIIIIIVIATVLVCAILISVICLMITCKVSPNRDTSRIIYETDGMKTINNLPTPGQSQYDNNTKFTDINESLLTPSSNFYLINNQPSTNNYRPPNIGGYRSETFDTMSNCYRKVNNNDGNDSENDGTESKPISSSITTGINDSKRISSTDYRESPQLFTAPMSMNMAGGHFYDSYRQFIEDPNGKFDTLDRNMNWTIRSGYNDQPNYAVMYNNMNRTSGYSSTMPGYNSNNVNSTSAL